MLNFEDTVNDETSEVEDEIQESNYSEPETEEVEETEEEEVDWKTEAQKAKELAENYKKRAEKAEQKAKGAKPTASTGLSAQDLLALSKANIESDDLDEVLDYAAYKKLSIHEALKSSVLKATLAEKAELRKSASAVNTGATRRANTGISDDRLLEDARKGVMPESDADFARLAKLQLTRK